LAISDDDTAVLKDAMILWDLDGTLVDTARDLTAALNAVLAERGLGPVPAERVRYLVGDGALALIRRALALHATAVPGPTLHSMRERFIEIYDADPVAHSGTFPGIMAALNDFQSARAVQAVATNKPQRLAEALLFPDQRDQHPQPRRPGDDKRREAPLARCLIVLVHACGPFSVHVPVLDPSPSLVLSGARSVG